MSQRLRTVLLITLGLLWGGPALSSRSLSTANVTFFGRDVGGRMGAILAAGDINRDTPNDLVFVSPPARAGTGGIDIYYGRGRTSIGTAQPDGTRVVDFATDAPSSARAFVSSAAV